MQISQIGIDLIKKFEGCSLTAYKCPSGINTIGYGHTKGVKMGDVITQEQAEQFLKDDLKVFEAVINVYVLSNYQLNQNEFDALVSLCYNIGTNNFKNSTMLKKLMARDKQGAAKQFDFWVLSKGKKLQGLVNRRKAEKELFLKEEK